MAPLKQFADRMFQIANQRSDAAARAAAIDRAAKRDAEQQVWEEKQLEARHAYALEEQATQEAAAQRTNALDAGNKFVGGLVPDQVARLGAALPQNGGTLSDIAKAMAGMTAPGPVKRTYTGVDDKQYEMYDDPATGKSFSAPSGQFVQKWNTQKDESADEITRRAVMSSTQREYAGVNKLLHDGTVNLDGANEQLAGINSDRADVGLQPLPTFTTTGMGEKSTMGIAKTEVGIRKDEAGIRKLDADTEAVKNKAYQFAETMKLNREKLGLEAQKLLSLGNYRGAMVAIGSENAQTRRAAQIALSSHYTAMEDIARTRMVAKVKPVSDSQLVMDLTRLQNLLADEGMQTDENMKETFSVLSGEYRAIVEELDARQRGEVAPAPVSLPPGALPDASGIPFPTPKVKVVQQPQPAKPGSKPVPKATTGKLGPMASYVRDLVKSGATDQEINTLASAKFKGKHNWKSIIKNVRG